MCQELLASENLVDDVADFFEKTRKTDSLVILDGDIIRIKHDNDWTYDVPLDDCRTVTGVLQWIVQLTDKKWFDDYCLKRFCRVVFKEITKDEHPPF